MMGLQIGDVYVYPNGRAFTIDVEDRIQFVEELLKEGKLEYYYPVSSRQEIGVSLTDSPTKPDHYHSGGIDVFTYAFANFTVEEVNAYHQITAIKYITRAGKKDGNPYEQDIQKAITHLQECLKGEGK